MGDVKDFFGGEEQMLPVAPPLMHREQTDPASMQSIDGWFKSLYGMWLLQLFYLDHHGQV